MLTLYSDFRQLCIEVFTIFTKVGIVVFFTGGTITEDA